MNTIIINSKKCQRLEERKNALPLTSGLTSLLLRGHASGGIISNKLLVDKNNFVPSWLGLSPPTPPRQAATT